MCRGSKGLLTLPLLALGACSDDDAATLEIPRLGTEWLLVAAAGGGRPLSPLDVQIRRSTDVTELVIPGTGNVNVDMLFAGLREEDLPKGLTPDELEFVSKVTPQSRPVPPLVSPHILNTPAPPGAAGRLSPVDDPNFSDDVREDRRARFERLLEALAIKDPCAPFEPVVPFTIPRTQGEAVFDVHVSADGTAIFGLSATGTAIVGRLDSEQRRFEQIGLSVDIVEGERVAIWKFGPSEVQLASGEIWPANLILLRGGVLGRTISLRDGRYVDDTPTCVEGEACPFTHFIGRPGGLSELSLNGVESVCAFGEVASTCTQGGLGACEAGVWCRPKSGGEWSETAVIPKAVRVVAFLPSDLGPLAINLAGTIFAERAPGDWQEVVRPNADPDCLIGCVRLDQITIPRDSGEVLAVLAGQKAQAWVLARQGSSVAYERITTTDNVLFGDEREGGARELEFLSANFAPDGALWLGTQHQRLIRVSADRTEARRVCLPDGAEGSAVTALGFTEGSNRMILGVSPPAILVGTW
ncbi:MAG: hypothetical protein HYV07_01010 [Deltaproteobacteria bacterium]|nr:hypothetical protein [Deltaproteobacteria bacterium]